MDGRTDACMSVWMAGWWMDVMMGSLHVSNPENKTAEQLLVSEGREQPRAPLRGRALS